MSADYPKRETIANYWPLWAAPSTHTGALTEANSFAVFAIPFRQFHAYMLSGKADGHGAKPTPAAPKPTPRARSRAKGTTLPGIH